MITLETLTPEVIELFKLLNNNKIRFEKLSIDELIKELIDKNLWTDDTKLLFVETIKTVDENDKFDDEYEYRCKVYCKFLNDIGNKLYSEFLLYNAKKVLDEKSANVLLHNVKELLEEKSVNYIYFLQLYSDKIYNGVVHKFDEKLYQKIRRGSVVFDTFKETYLTKIGFVYENINFVDLTLNENESKIEYQVTDFGKAIYNQYRETLYNAVNQKGFNLTEELRNIAEKVNCTFYIDRGEDNVLLCIDENDICIQKGYI